MANVNILVHGNWRRHATYRQIIVYGGDLYLLTRKPQENTGMDLVIMLYLSVQ